MYEYLPLSFLELNRKRQLKL